MHGTVIIVEDEDNVAALEIALMSLHGLQVRVYRNARSALTFLDTCDDVALIVTDLNLPDVDGYELIGAVRARKRCASIPIVVVSGDGQNGIAQRVRDSGANAFFAKPYSPAAVCRTVEAFLCDD